MSAAPSPLVLASRSPYRLKLLQDAGLAVEAVRPEVDERAVETAVGGDLEPSDLASLLAETKAADVSPRRIGQWVIGADQVLELDGQILHKVEDMKEARRRLLALQGRTHHLHSAIVLARDGRVLWRGLETASLTMRPLTPAQVGQHLAEAGDGVLGSVGAYQIEGRGVRLFERVEGDMWTVIGLPLIPLLGALREHGALND